MTQYFNFFDKEAPVDLEGETLSVTGRLHVRSGMPDVIGQFPEVIDILKVGSSVEVVKVEEWHETGYMWAHIKYSDKR